LPTINSKATITASSGAKTDVPAKAAALHGDYAL
jgi:hypothetical protein